ncbi:Anaphase-promoting complex subunit 23 [Rhizophlyctis rosea]|uniref:Anaphase-promoting complex subunit 23 n=1 Tax=Rhizophlyctis rosea TaxID=64517 RepID=A0AAD5WZR5_9FUNG|nr:Anaphase-promoting complex subunit 23 [Rhizophlyctis rosea]
MAATAGATSHCGGPEAFTISQLRDDLRAAVNCLNDRCLFLSAKCPEQRQTSNDFQRPSRDYDAAQLDEDDIAESDLYALARCYFQNREYARVAKKLEDVKGPRATFLKLYASYLKGEKEKEEKYMGQETPLEEGQWFNKELQDIETQLGEGHREDAFCLYLRGIVNTALKRTARARDFLSESVKRYPWNWSAWEALVSTYDGKDVRKDPLNEIREHVPEHSVMRDFCVIHLANELALSPGDALDAEWKSVEALFPDSSTVNFMKGMSYYCVRDFDKAMGHFQKLHKRDPFRVDHMDIYSNTLYIRQRDVELAELAHQIFDIDRYRYESCLIVGNYYSIRREHDFAIMFFQRALKLNRNYIEAWTLIGHEYLELQNLAAAVAVYRKATVIKPSDYRAWYGLGCAYRMMSMHDMAITYFQKALAVQPNDYRMWFNLGQLYHELKHYSMAVASLERAMVGDKSDLLALWEIARCYYEQLEEPMDEKLEHETRKRFLDYLKFQEKYEGTDVSNQPNQEEAALWVAKAALKRGKSDEALSVIQFITRHDCDEANEIRKEIWNLQSNERARNPSGFMRRAVNIDDDDSMEAFTP